MDLKKLGNLLLVGGALVLAGAFVWWMSFYSSVMGDVSRVPGAQSEFSVFDAISCLYTSSDFCGLVSGAARMLGRTPYEPKVFWLGLAAFVVGGLIRATAKPSGPR